MNKLHCFLISAIILVWSCSDTSLMGIGDANFLSNRITKNTASLSVPDSVLDLENAVISVSKHYRGHRATFCEGDDAYTATTAGNVWGAEMFGFRHNFGLTVFNNGVNQAEKDAFHNGRIDFGVYSSTNSPNYTTADPLMAGLRDGVYCSAAAYASGVDSYKLSLLPIFLGARNSVMDTSLIQYAGLTDVQMISRGGTFREEYYSDLVAPSVDFQYGTEAQGASILADVVSRVMSKGGWYRNFTHWNRWNLDYSKRYFNRLDSLIQVNGGDAAFISWNTAIEYYWTKESVDSVKASGKTVSVYYHKDYPSSPYNRITTPVWIKVDLSGTAYAGNDITTSHGGKIRSMGSDVYYIAYPLEFSSTSGTFDITTTSTPSYINLNKPNAVRSGQVINIDQPVKMVVFTKAKTEPLEMKVVLHGTAAQARFTTYGTTFTVPKAFNTTTNDYYIDCINAEGVSSELKF